MRFPSLEVLTHRAVAVLRRFPWTLAAGAITATMAILASHNHGDAELARIAFVAVLGLPLTIALTLTAEARGWGPVVRTVSLIGGVVLLVLFYLGWPGIDDRTEGIRYLQFAVVLHLAVAFLPFLAVHHRVAFWQYNRRLFLGFLRAGLFSAVIFVGVAIALGALDKLFGVDVRPNAYLHIWFVAAFVVNSWIFVASIPEDLGALADDVEYPKALKVFAQYILTPLAFGYLLILLAYLVKIVAGGEWPNGWIGWLVASVAVTGLLGFLLVEPLRTDPAEGWIRIYARWLFLGLIPASLMLLTAFWKRIEPYGLTEPRSLGLLLGIWLLGTAVIFSIRPGTSIKAIPLSLSLLLAATLYGPVSVTRLSVQSQGRRLASTLPAGSAAADPSEASAALRFLMDHHAEAEIARRIGKPFPATNWSTIHRFGPARDSLGKRLMALAGATYLEEGASFRNRSDFSFAFEEGLPLSVEGFHWLATVNASDTARHALGPDSMQALPRGPNGKVRIALGVDTLVFDLHPLLQRYRDSLTVGRGVPSSALRVASDSGRRAGSLILRGVSGRRLADSLLLKHWYGTVLIQ